MCPLWPAHCLLTYMFFVIPVWIISFHALGIAASALPQVTFTPDSIDQLTVGESIAVQVSRL